MLSPGRSVVAGLVIVGGACLDVSGRARSVNEQRPPSYPAYIAIQEGTSYALPRVSGVSRLSLPTGVVQVEWAAGDSVLVTGLRRGFAEWDPTVDVQHPVRIAVLAQRRGAPILVGHHGVPSAAPENTLGGLRIACTVGIPGIEVDVRFTADSVPVLMHDRDVARTSNGTGYVDKSTIAQLKLLDVGSWFGPEFVGERIPTLIDFLRAAAECGFDHIQLDMKSFVPLGRDSAWVRIGRAVNEGGLLPRVFVASDVSSLKRAVTLIPGVHTLVYGGLVSLTFADTLIRSGVDAIGVSFDQYKLSASALAHLDSAGIIVGVWAPPAVLDLNTLTPTPRFVTSDWGWRFVH